MAYISNNGNIRHGSGSSKGRLFQGQGSNFAQDFVQSKKTFVDTTNMTEEEKKKEELRQQLEAEVNSVSSITTSQPQATPTKPKPSKARGVAAMSMAIASFVFLAIPLSFYLSSGLSGNVVGSAILFWLFLLPFMFGAIIIAAISFITNLVIFFTGKKTAGVIIGLLLAIVAVVGNGFFTYYFIALSTT